MGLIFQIAWRFLLAKKRAMLMSLAGIVFGVAFFIVAQAQTSGFESFFIRAVWGTNGALKVQDKFQNNIVTSMSAGEKGDFRVKLSESRTYVEGIAHPAEVLRAVRSFSEVRGASEVLRGQAVAKSGFREDECEVNGIRLADHLAVSDLAAQVRAGSLADFARNPQTVLIGAKLAERLSLDVGSGIILKQGGESRRYRVAAIFETGVEEFDKRRVYLDLREARGLLHEPEKSSFIQVTLADNNKADVVAAHMQEVLQHDVRPWQKSEKTWLQVFATLRISSAITMGVIISVAALGMFNTLAIIVMERRREIAILRSMGYTRRDIVAIFVSQGMMVLFAGLLLGCLAAAAITYGIERLPIHIRGIFSADHFVVKWSLWHYVFAAILSTVVVLVASYLPARRAAKVEPGEIIRGAS
jgi:lipoprotein-releasing system permease protein